MQEFLILFMLFVSFCLGHVVSTGKWREKYYSLQMHNETHTESLKILLDNAVDTNEKNAITISVLTSEINRLKEGTK